MISQRAQKTFVSADSADKPLEKKDTTRLDTSMLPDGANLEALQAIEDAAEDPLATAAKRPLMLGESRTPPEPRKKRSR